METTQTHLIDLRHDLRNKLSDGILPAVVLITVWWMVSLVVTPVQQGFGRPGLMVYTLGLLAISMYALQRAVYEKTASHFNAWFGIVGGFLAWVVTEMTAFLGPPVFNSPGGIVIIIMTGLIVSILWRSVLPFGAKFFVATFLLNWIEHVLMYAQETFSAFSPIFALTYRITGYTAVAGALTGIVYILFHSQSKLQRVCAALLIWFCFSLAVYVFRGSLY